jgi:hypothetical protein
MPHEVNLYNVTHLLDCVIKGVREPLVFELGEEVFVALRSQKPTGRACIVGLPTEKRGRHRVNFIRDGVDHVEGGGSPVEEQVGGGSGAGKCDLFHDVRVGKLFPVVQRTTTGNPLVSICAETADFRRLARTQVRRGDRVIELGCSYGAATKILEEQAGPGYIVGVDLGVEALTSARRLCPGSRFEHVDVVSCDETETAERLTWLASLLRAPGDAPPTLEDMIVFVDIGGNRALPPLVTLLRRLLHNQALRPAQASFQPFFCGGGAAKSPGIPRNTLSPAPVKISR